MITSANNQRIKNLTNLIQKAKARREQDVFITEGVKMFLEADMEIIKEVYVSESFFEKGTAREKMEQCNYEVLSDELFKKVSDTQTPQGILCVMKQFHYKLDDLFQKENPLFLILEDIQDPGNLGTMMRTAEGAGVDGVIMTKATVDIYNPKTIRSAMGSLYRTKVTIVKDFESFINAAKHSGRRVFAAELSDNAKSLHEVGLTTKDIVVIGNEGHGIPKDISSITSGSVFIPISKKTESLNASVAAAIFMWEQNK